MGGGIQYGGNVLVKVNNRGEAEAEQQQKEKEIFYLEWLENSPLAEDSLT